MILSLTNEDQNTGGSSSNCVRSTVNIVIKSPFILYVYSRKNTLKKSRMARPRPLLTPKIATIHKLAGFCMIVLSMWGLYDRVNEYKSSIKDVPERKYSSVETFVLFTGHPRSGHSMVGAMLDAHPRAIVSHELGFLMAAQAMDRDDALQAIVNKSIKFDDQNQQWVDYQYHLGPYHAKAGPLGPLLVLGDKSGGLTAAQVAKHGLKVLIYAIKKHGIQKTVLLNVRRDPYDIISTAMMRKFHWKMKIQASKPVPKWDNYKRTRFSGPHVAQVLNRTAYNWMKRERGTRMIRDNLQEIRAKTGTDVSFYSFSYEELCQNFKPMWSRVLHQIGLTAEPEDDPYYMKRLSHFVRQPFHSSAQVEWPVKIREMIENFQ